MVRTPSVVLSGSSGSPQAHPVTDAEVGLQGRDVPQAVVMLLFGHSALALLPAFGHSALAL
jgi:hypothetical protein